MNKMHLFVLLVTVFIFSCTTQQVNKMNVSDKHETHEAQNLFFRLTNLAENGIMFGHQDDLAYGHGWQDQPGRSDVKSICTDYPAVYGWDLGKLETGSSYNLDSVNFEKITGYARQINKWGGINTFSWHADNPLTGGNTWDITNSGTVSSILPGGAKHELYKQWLDRLAIFFLNLTDEKGNPIPVIFRPFHEHSGNWFWWGKNHCPADEYIRLWRFTVDYFRDTKKIHHLLYAYSNTDEFAHEQDYLARYPGDGYIDILGFDSYQFPNLSDTAYIEKLGHALKIITNLAAKKHKIAALTEAGYESVPVDKWWTGVLWPAVKSYKISYVFLWRNAHNRPTHYFVPFPGQESEKDFIDFYNLPKTLFLKDIKEFSVNP